MRVHQIAIHDRRSKAIWDRYVLAYTRIFFCFDGFPYVIAPVFSTLHFLLLHFQPPAPTCAQRTA